MPTPLSLRTRLERLEMRAPEVRLDEVPEEVLERRFDLLLKMYVHGKAGLPVDELRRELEALEPLGVDFGQERRTTNAELYERTVGILQSEPGNAEYGRLLGLLPETGASAS